MEKIASFEIDTITDREKCFHYVSNMDNFANWFPGVIAIVSENQEPIGVGKQYIETVKIPLVGLREITLTVTDFEQYSRFSTEGSMAPLLPRMEIFLSSGTDGKTKIDWAFYSRNSSLFFKMVAPLFRSVMDKRAKTASINLKEILASIGQYRDFEQES